MQLSLLDRLVGYLDPARGVQRLAARATLEQIETLVGGQGGYDAGKLNRLMPRRPNLHENGVPRSQFQRMAADARDLYRNNPHARKICRQIEVKTIGQGMRLQSAAKKGTGKPHVAFRTRAQQVLSQFAAASDWRGRPGRGGQSLTDQAKSALRCAVRTGNVLYRLRPLSPDEQARRGAILPLAVQLVDGDRLDDSVQSWEGRPVLFGVELTETGPVAGYHLHAHHPTDPRWRGAASQRVSVDDALHLFVADDVDQIAGASWFACALQEARHIDDYEYNELLASAMGACVVLSVQSGVPGSFGGLQGSGDNPLLDKFGNEITRLQPGMIFRDKKIEGFNPQRPNQNAAGFIDLMLRTMSTAFPGIKGATLTGDYRGSSFSSERSADNEVWPEIEGVQAWFASAFYQPIYEAVIDFAVIAGLFDGVVSVGEYVERRAEFLAATWTGPVAKSINPKDDREAAALGVRNLSSSPQIEAAKEGRNVYENLADLKEFVENVAELGLPPKIAEQLVLQVIGVGSAVDGSTVTVPPDPAATDDEPADDLDDETDSESDDAGDDDRAFACLDRLGVLA